MTEFVKERHKAFADVLYNDDFKAMDKYCKKYGVPKPKSKKVQKAGIYKAIQQCTDFTEEEKTKAMVKCLELGFNPFMRPYGYDTEDGGRE